MRRTLVAGLLVSMTVAAAFAYRVQAQQGARWPPTVPSPGTILIADSEPQAQQSAPMAPAPDATRRMILAEGPQQAPAAAPAAAAAPVPTQPPGPVHIVTFVDITPNNKDAGTAYCKQYVADTRKDAGLTSVQLLAQTNRPNHLVIYEVWQNEAAYEKHTTLAHTKDFHSKMVPIIGSPFDERPHYVVP
jgi:quinol monooxygenase YgiN